MSSYDGSTSEDYSRRRLWQVFGRPLHPTKGKRISFRGIHNRVKGKCFLVLNDAATAMTASQLAGRAHCKLVTVRSALTRWSSYRKPYVLRHFKMKNGRMIYVYGLSARGKMFIDLRTPKDVRKELEIELGIQSPEERRAELAASRARLMERFGQGYLRFQGYRTHPKP